MNQFWILDYPPIPNSSGPWTTVRKIIRWYLILFMLGALKPLLICDVSAAERIKPILIGALTDSWGPTPGVVGLRDGLKERGYRENQDFVIGVRFTQGNIAALPQAARELVAQKTDILFAVNPAPAKAAQMATSRIPIVFYGTGDPIGLGLVKSFAHPGGNITGVTDLDLELDSKRLEIFKEMIPGLVRACFRMISPRLLRSPRQRSIRESARRLKITLIEKTELLDRSTGDLRQYQQK